MKQNLFRVSVIAAGVLSATVAGLSEQSANAGIYFGGSGGVNWQSNTYFVNPNTAAGFRGQYKTGYNLGALLGFQYDQWRADLSFAYVKNDTKRVNNTSSGGHVRLMSYMVNGYYDIPLTDQLQPYFGAGLGLVSAKTVDQALGATNGSGTSFAYQGVLGLNLNIKPNFTVFGQYTNLHVSKTKFAGDFDISGTSNMVSLGLRYSIT